VGSDAARSKGEGVDVAQHLRNRFRGDKPEFAGLRGVPGDDARDVDSLVNIPEIASHIGRVFTLGVKAAAVEELHLGILLGHPQDVRIEIAEGGGEHHGRTVQVDHVAHGLLHGGCLRNAGFFDTLDPVEFLNAGAPLRMRLVVAVVVLGPDVDETHRHLVGGEGVMGHQSDRGQGKETQRQQDFGEQALHGKEMGLENLGLGFRGLKAPAGLPIRRRSTARSRRRPRRPSVLPAR
jgi:hypothetical protein